MHLSVERNQDPEQRLKAPYQINLEIKSATADWGRVYTIPVYITYVGVSKHFHVEICGVRLNTPKKPQNLLEPVELLCRSLVNMSRFPNYVFIARRAGHVYPVYTVKNEVVITTTGGGPIFRHVELAKVRTYLTDYLHRIAVLGSDGRSDKLHVRGINPHTLGLRRPVFYLKKRIFGEEEFWAPVFETGDRRGIYTYAASQRRDTPLKDGLEVLNLCDLVAHFLQVDRRLTDLYDLRADRLTPTYWARLRDQLEPVDSVFISGQKFHTYAAVHQRLWIGVENRPSEERFGLFLGHSPADVIGRIGRDLARRSQKYAMTP